MENNLLNFYGKTNGSYLHARGPLATEILLEKLDIQSGDNILEIGFGTGSTLVKAISRNKKSSFCGAEFSALMLNKTKSRLRFCRIKNNVSLKLMENHKTLPFESNFFDKVYAESVLAIQEDDNLLSVMEEIARVLKPGGKLIFNETIWLDSVSTEEARKINELCKQQFGIIQSNSKHTHIEQWKALLNKCHLTVISSEPLDHMKSKDKGHRTHAEVRSDIFNIMGKLKGLFNPFLNREFAKYKKSMSGFPVDKQYMEGVLFICKKEIKLV